MSENDPTPDVTCTLTETAAEERPESVRSVLGETFERAEEHADGYTLVFEEVGESLPAVATFVSNERECCSFADYAIAVSPPYDETELTITGPDGTKDQFETLVDRLASTTAPGEPDDDTPPPESSSSAREASDVSPVTRRRAVRERYADVANQSTADGETATDSERTTTSSCCGEDDRDDVRVDEKSRLMGYSDDAIDRVAPGANLGLGCGNPTGVASLAEGDVVLDLGSGGGFDCFLAAKAVGDDGRVIGVDMTPEMIETARENVENNEASNVEFRLGEIEHLPVADESVDVIISNCVVNLSPDKSQVLSEAFRVLRPGGRLAISDVVSTAELPTELQTDLDSIAGCVGGASTIPALESILADAGFEEISIDPDEDSDELIREWDPDRGLSEHVVSATIEATKPEGNGDRSPSR